MSGVKVITPAKSPEDKREYRILTLPNELTVVLCSDPETERAAAAMDVHVGHFNDPDDIPGLAHFLEHMLFLGTEKYPNENEYSSFLNAHGGSSNAYTSTENTVYFFDVVSEHLEGALDRFAQFFIAPLFTPSATDREMQAVHNENAKNLLSDSWRQFQLLKTTANPAHPFSKFGTGNLTTLRDEPKAKGIDVVAELKKFHATYYSANISKLAVIGRESLDQLQEWAVSKFSAVRNLARDVPTCGRDAFTKQQLAQLYEIVPVKDLRSLKITWPLDPVDKLYKVKPLSFLAHLLGHEAEGSILSLLKQRGWANGLSAGPQQTALGFSIFGVSIDLTPAGLAHANEIVTTVYQYIDALKKAGTEEWKRLWTEEAEINRLNFRFKSKEEPFHYCSQLANSLQEYAPEDILTGPWIYHTFDEKVIGNFLGALTPENMRVHVISKEFAGKTDQTEKWYQTEYSVKPLPEALTKALSSLAENKELYLPTPNPFIATDFTLKHSPAPPVAAAVKHTTTAGAEGEGEGKEGKDAGRALSVYPAYYISESPPSLVVDEPGLRCWHKADTKYCKPKANVMFKLVSPLAAVSPRHGLLTALFTRVLEDSLNEFSYNATLAGLSYKLSATATGMQLSLRGYNHKLSVLLDAVLKSLKDLQVKDERFTLLKEALTRQIQNFDQEQPYQHAMVRQAYSLLPDVWTNKEKFQALAGLTADDLREHARLLFKQAEAELLVHGNLTSEEAVLIAKQVKSTLGYHPLAPSQRPQERLVMLKPGTDYLMQALEENPADVNSALIMSFQMGPEAPALSARLDLLAHLTREPCFDALRTQEQLGYLVFSGPQTDRGILAFRVILQSSDRPADYLDSRAEAFLSAFRATLAAMPEEEFKRNLSAVIAMREEKDKTLNEESARHWGEIITRKYVFDRAEQEVAILRSLSLADLLATWDEHVLINSPTRRKIAVQVFGNGHPPPAVALRTVEINCVSRADALADPKNAALIAPKLPATSPASPTPTPASDDGAAGGDGAPASPAAAVVSPTSAAASRPVPENKAPVVHVTDFVAFKRSMPLWPCA